MPVRAVAVVATAIAIASAWHSGPGVWRRLDTEHRVYAGYSDFQRRLAPVADVPLPTGIFEFWAGSVLPRDRIFFQVRPAPFSAFFDLPEIVSAAGRFYLLPAVQVRDPREATVVLSWEQDPSRLHLHYVSRRRYGSQAIFVSRVSNP